MSASDLERLERAVLDAVRSGEELGPHLQQHQVPPEAVRRCLFLALTGQVHVAGLLDETKRSLEKALAILTPETAYLRDELQKLLDDVLLLLVKVQDEEELRCSRDILG